MLTEKRYMILVATTLVLEVILFSIVKYNQGLRDLYYTEGFVWFMIVFGISSVFRCVYPAILFFEKKPDILHGYYFFSILGSNILFLSLIYIAYRNFNYEITEFANIWTFVSLAVGFVSVFTALLLIGGGLKFWEGSAVFLTALLTFARLLYFFAQYGLAIQYFYPLNFVVGVYRLDVIFFVIIGLLQINYVRRIYRY